MEQLLESPTTLFLAAAISAVLYLLMTQSRKSSTAQVAELWIYPIKSCGGIKVNSVQFDRLGPLLDRRLLVFSLDTKRVATIRQNAKMATIRTELHGNELILTAEGMSKLCVPLEGTELKTKHTVKIFDDVADAWEVNDNCNAWFSEYLGQKLALGKVDMDTFQRPLDKEFDCTKPELNLQVAFADGFPLLIASEASLDYVNSHLTDEPVTMEHFRPNIVVRGVGPFTEDSWAHIRVGSLDLDVVKPCTRCSLPTVSPKTGKRHPNFEPIKTMRGFRAIGESVFFGQNAVARLPTGTINVNDEVIVLKTKNDDVAALSSSLRR
eukprot:m.19426 g.19426  ORF g.19426 m.19426 type:complete len:323 (+) comp12229_c0_seq2:239-1207(+)